MYRLICAAVLASIALPAAAEEVVNIYSSRHYDTDERLYSDFEAATGITVNRIEGKADELIARMVAEGRNSPADILITVDASRIWRADQQDLFQPVESDTLENRIPAYLRHPMGHWFGFSLRSRIIFYDKETVSEPPKTYADLANPLYEGQICMRSSTNVYSQTLLASVITHTDPEAAADWARGLKNNLARNPQGGDTDQLRGIVSGECQIAVSNTYYFARALRTEVAGVSADIDRIGWIFPDQSGIGAHVNVSGAGVAKHAPNRENAVKFLEYLASDSAQEYFSAGNDEYPAVPGVALSPSVAALGFFRADTAALADIARNTSAAQEIYNAIGFR